MQRKEAIYENGVAYWQCFKCKQWLPETDYYADKKSYNHLKSLCKRCHTEESIRTQNPDIVRKNSRERQRRAYHANPLKFRLQSKSARLQAKLRGTERKQPRNDKTKARQILNDAVVWGKIVKPSNCSQCGKLRRITAHHKDYSKPLQVRWLCYECHGKETIIGHRN